MIPLLMAAASGIGSAAQTGLSIYSALQASRGASNANQSTMDYNAEQARIQRDWEEGMFNSRYQRTRRDLEAAGYNPLLALNGQPPVPGGSAAHVPLLMNEKAQASEIGHQTARALSQIALERAEIDRVIQDTRTAKAHADMAELERDMTMTPAGKAMKWVNMLWNSGLGGIVGTGLGWSRAGGIAKAIAKQPRITINAGRRR